MVTYSYNFNMLYLFPTNKLFFYYYWIKFIDFVDLNKAMNNGNPWTVRANSLTTPTGVLLTTLRQSPSKFSMRLLFFLMILIQKNLSLMTLWFTWPQLTIFLSLLNQVHRLCGPLQSLILWVKSSGKSIDLLLMKSFDL